MKISQHQLENILQKKYSPQDWDTLLSMHGLEVESMQPVASAFTHVVVAQILTAAPHPNAQKLQVCQVQVAVDDVRQIVCGAANARVGIKVACALEGAILPMNGKDLHIQATTLRGEASQGMLCSAQELGLSEKSDGILELPADAPIGQNLRSYLDVDDHIIDIKITPNRGDCLSVLGLAREVAAIDACTYQMPTWQNIPGSFHHHRSIVIEDTQLCGRFVGRLIKNINANVPTPAFMRQALERAGIRPIHMLVDASNYVMLMLGQPNHIFNADVLGDTLTITRLKTLQSLHLIDHQTVELQAGTGVIMDEQRVLSIAGVMGGAHSKVEPDTQSIYLEAAFWYPEAIHGTAKKYKLNSDAAYRYERGVDPHIQQQAIDYLSAIIAQYCATDATEFAHMDHLDPHVPPARSISLCLSRVDAVLGFHIPAVQIRDILTALQCSLIQKNDDVYEVSVPSYRFDLHIEADLIEEIVRLHGFDNIPLRMPHATMHMLPIATTYDIHHFRQALAQLGYQEVINFGFEDAKLEASFALEQKQPPAELLNPLVQHANVLKTQLISGLIQKLQYNQAQHTQNVRLFEVATVFIPQDSNNLTQKTHIAALWNTAHTPKTWLQADNQDYFYSFKADVEQLCRHIPLRFVPDERLHDICHPGRSAMVYHADTQACLGYMGQLHPKMQQTLDVQGVTYIMELDYDLLAPMSALNLQIISPFPSVKRDLAWVVDANLPAEQLIQALPRQHQGINIDQAHVFDVFYFDDRHAMAGKKSLALSFYLSKDGATLLDEEIQAAFTAAQGSIAHLGFLR